VGPTQSLTVGIVSSYPKLKDLDTKPITLFQLMSRLKMYGITYIATYSCLQQSSWYSAQSSTEGTLPSTVIFVARLLYRLHSGLKVDTTAIFAWWQWGDNQTLDITTYRVCFWTNACYMSCQSLPRSDLRNILWTVRIVQILVMQFFLHRSLGSVFAPFPFFKHPPAVFVSYCGRPSSHPWT